jgi:hypothetical protein
MENNDKTGRAILDNHIKAVKKLTKNMEIRPRQNDGYYMDSDLRNSVFKIKSIRKYKHIRTIWTDNQEQYVYEIDVIVDMRTETTRYYQSNFYCQRYAKRYNSWYRRCILGAMLSELKYFGIEDRNSSIVISKIQYAEI